VSSRGGEEMRIGKRFLSLALAATPRGVGWALDSRRVRDGSGVAPGANTRFGVVLGMLGENMLAAGGLSEMLDAWKRFLAPLKLLPRLPDGASSRVNKVLRVWGVAARLLKLP